MYACLYRPPSCRATLGSPALSGPPPPLAEIAEQFSPRYERHRDDLVSIDVSGLARLIGPARTIGEELRRAAAARGGRAHVAVAGTRMAAMVLALARPGLTVVARGEEAEAIAPVRIEILQNIDNHDRTQSAQRPQRTVDPKSFAAVAVCAFKRWGLKTLGEVAALPPADLVSRLGRPALAWQAIARGEDLRPLVPTLAEERFEATLELEWPIEDLEPLSFVLTRLLEPLSTRLERRDRGAAVLHVLLRLVTRDSAALREPQGRPEHGREAAGGAREVYARRLELPAPIRDVRTLRTLALLDLESHPPAAAVDAVTIVIDPTPGRVLQHTLFTRAHPTPEQLSTLVARLGALMGQDRFGAAATVDSHRPGAFVMTPFACPEHRRGATEHDDQRRTRRTRDDHLSEESAVAARSALNAVTAMERKARKAREAHVQGEPSALSAEPSLRSALRRCRHPVPARVAVAGGRPVRVTTDRRGYAGGMVTWCAGPWRTSGEWWASDVRRQKSEVQTSDVRRHTSGAGGAGPWDRDEWDVALGDGGVYRMFRERDTDRWFVDAIVD